MTLQERAEKIALDVHKLQHPGTFHVDWNENGRSVIALIAAQIEEAEKEIKEQLHYGQIHLARVAGKLEGFKEARNKAAEIAENEPVNILRSQSHEGLRLSIADRIRSMAPGEGGAK